MPSNRGRLTKAQYRALEMFREADAGILFAAKRNRAWAGLNAKMIPNPMPIPDGPWNESIPPGCTMIEEEVVPNEVIMQLFELRLIEPIDSTDTPWRGPFRLSTKGKTELALWR